VGHQPIKLDPSPNFGKRIAVEGIMAIDPKQKELLGRITSRLVNQRMGTPATQLRRALGSDRRLIDELLRMRFLQIVDAAYLPTLRGVLVLDEDVQNVVISVLTSILQGGRRLFESDDRTTFGINVILEAAKEYDKSLDMDYVLPALILGEELGFYRFPRGLHIITKDLPNRLKEEDRVFIEEVTIFEDILDFTTVEDRWKEIQSKELQAETQNVTEQSAVAQSGGAIREASRIAVKSVFIGHGHSLVWLKLKDFLTSRLGLTCVEFNSESVAGITTTARLEELLGNASFAFLVMTAEDTHADNTVHARENVIHEVGLFQGRLGFRRAIILLEEGCEPFSNIHGLTYIAFPKDKLESAFEEIRRVLERENTGLSQEQVKVTQKLGVSRTTAAPVKPELHISWDRQQCVWGIGFHGTERVMQIIGWAVVSITGNEPILLREAFIKGTEPVMSSMSISIKPGEITRQQLSTFVRPVIVNEDEDLKTSLIIRDHKNREYVAPETTFRHLQRAQAGQTSQRLPEPTK
jgi:predicted nucleotide-binding protein